MENKPRYAIVRVDNKCPDEFEKIDVEYICRNISCYQGKECSKNFYGDTKELLVAKVAQEIFKAKLERYRQVWKFECSEMEKRCRYNDSLILARKIVEFLGVEE